MPGFKNSTYVRSFSAARLVLAPLARVAPQLTAGVAERLFFTPPRPHRSRGERVLRQAERLELAVDGDRLAAWRWGGSGPTVVLLHGWGGRAAQLSDFVPALRRRGFSVVAFDAPGHGRSGRRLSSAPQFARALRALADRIGGLHAVVAHSLGAAAAALALRDGLAIERVVFLAPPAEPPAWIATLAARLGLGPDVLARLRARSEKRIGLDWSELVVPALAAGQRVPLLVVHDRQDRQVPVGEGQAVAAAWPGARLVETSGLGHNRLLRNPGVVEQVAAFVDGDVASASPHPGHDPLERLCQTCLERELFDPGLRPAPQAG